MNANFLFSKSQMFSIPDPIIHYINSNPSTPNVYQKLVTACKYFFIKNPVLIIDEIDISVNFSKIKLFNQKKEEENVNFSRIFIKLWITKKIRVYQPDRKVASRIASKIWRCDVLEVKITNQKMSLKKFILYFSSAKICFIGPLTVYNSNRKRISFEKYITNLKNVEHLIL